ncbi:MAG: class II aldolase/adducin family protein [Firmicutes bacterium]|nr:class II aldolase/adducin family protein [Bacillota bacterium]
MSNTVKLPTDSEAKALILDIGRRMYDKNFCAANDGNISCRAEDGNFWVTPSGVSKGFMKEEMLVKVDASGNIIEKNGDYKISSEIKLHLKVYEERPDMNAVVHAHPPVSTAFACARKPLNKPVVTEAVLILGEVPVAPFAVPGTPELAETIVPHVHGHAACLLANHGALTWGTDLIQAYYRLETTEYYANMMVLTGEMPVPVHVLNDEELAAVEERRKGYGITF